MYVYGLFLLCRSLHLHIDFVVCLGGDGVLLHASALFKEAIPPVISFNLVSDAGASGKPWSRRPRQHHVQYPPQHLRYRTTAAPENPHMSQGCFIGLHHFDESADLILHGDPATAPRAPWAS